jgi:hypothetical protein
MGKVRKRMKLKEALDFVRTFSVVQKREILARLLISLLDDNLAPQDQANECRDVLINYNIG